jgi:hypothetical protein
MVPTDTRSGPYEAVAQGSANLLFVSSLTAHPLTTDTCGLPSPDRHDGTTVESLTRRLAPCIPVAFD